MLLYPAYVTYLFNAELRHNVVIMYFDLHPVETGGLPDEVDDKVICAGGGGALVAL